MIEIKDLLLRFENILSGERLRTGAVKKVLEESMGIYLQKEDIKIKDNIIYLNIKPLYKSEIFLKKEKLLLSLKSVLGNKCPQDIR